MTCPRCGKAIVFPDFPHGRAADCQTCSDEDYQRRSRGYDRAQAMKRHPAGKRRRKIWTEWVIEAPPFGQERWRPTK